MKTPEPKYKGTEVELATLKEAPDVGIEDHGMFFMWAWFDYGGSSQGLGYGINTKFIKSIIRVFGVEKLSQCKGDVFVEHDQGKIYRLIPLQTKNGKEFDIQKGDWWDTKKEKI